MVLYTCIHIEIYAVCLSLYIDDIETNYLVTPYLHPYQPAPIPPATHATRPTGRGECFATLNSQLSTLNSQLSTLDSTLDSRLSTLNSQLSTFNSQLSILKLSNFQLSNSQLSTICLSLTLLAQSLGRPGEQIFLLFA